MTRGRCPAPAEVERVYWSTRDRDPAERDLELHAHIAACPDCTAHWTEIAGLVALGGKLAPPGAWDRREEIRTTLLSSEAARPAAKPARPRVLRWAIPAFAAAAAIALLVWRWPAGGDVEVHESRRSAVLEHGATRHLVVSAAPDEIVRLVDGTVTITVATLGPGERFRLITGDGEIDAASAAFDAAARDDRLVSVRAIRGAVKVLVAGTSTALQPGESWRAATDLASAPPDAGAPADAAVIAVAPPAPPPAPTVEPRQVAPSRAPIARAPREAVPEAVSVEPPPAAPAEPVVVDAPPAPMPRSMVQQAFDAGWTALRANDFAAAAAAFERALALATEPQMIEDATYWRGVALARAGKVVVAAHVFSAFLTAYPSSARTHEVSVMLGWLLFERGDIADAKRRFEAGRASPSRDVRDSAETGLRAIAARR